VRKAKNINHLAIAYHRFSAVLMELRSWEIYPFPVSAINQYESLKRLRVNIGNNDLRIAAIALEFGAVIVTRNLRDFGRIPGVITQELVRLKFYKQHCPG
jgi:tRNA(fMet)-specific endonuclease VapC